MPTPANDSPLEVACPQCGKKVIWGPESTYRPFCSKRCQLLEPGRLGGRVTSHCR